MTVDMNMGNMYNQMGNMDELNRDNQAGNIKGLEEDYVVNDLKNIYVDPVKIDDLFLKEAHTPYSIQKGIGNNKVLENLNFKRESFFFNKERVQNMSGDLTSAQAGKISASQVAKLLE